MSDLQAARIDGRRENEMRPIKISPGYMRNPEGSALIQLGNTHVLCAASIEERVPSFLVGKGQGWVTAEYGMLPRSTNTRMTRESTAGRMSGRTQEIQRLIGRSLRAAIDLSTLGERSIYIDCDVLEADGGTRTAAITGGWVALALAIETLMRRGLLTLRPKLIPVAATSVGVVRGQLMLDLAYTEDSSADVDFNVVMTEAGDFVEVQGTAEHGTYSRETVNKLLDLAAAGITDLVALQRKAVLDSTS